MEHPLTRRQKRRAGGVLFLAGSGLPGSVSTGRIVYDTGPIGRTRAAADWENRSPLRAVLAAFGPSRSVSTGRIVYDTGPTEEPWQPPTGKTVHPFGRFLLPLGRPGPRRPCFPPARDNVILALLSTSRAA